MGNAEVSAITEALEIMATAVSVTAMPLCFVYFFYTKRSSNQTTSLLIHTTAPPRANGGEAGSRRSLKLIVIGHSLWKCLEDCDTPLPLCRLITHSCDVDRHEKLYNSKKKKPI